MKQVCVHYVLAAFLLAVIAVPVVGNVAKTADRSPGRTVQAPIVTANVFPTPWPCTGKSCKSVMGEPRTVIANGFPTPWPCTGKSCKPCCSLVVGGAGAVVTTPTQIANVFPTPWPCNGKSCTSVAGEISPALANVFPTPWPCTGKSCKFLVGEMPTAVADAWPTPWPKKPGFELS